MMARKWTHLWWNAHESMVAKMKMPPPERAVWYLARCHDLHLSPCCLHSFERECHVWSTEVQSAWMVRDAGSIRVIGCTCRQQAAGDTSSQISCLSMQLSRPVKATIPCSRWCVHSNKQLGRKDWNFRVLQKCLLILSSVVHCNAAGLSSPRLHCSSDACFSTFAVGKCSTGCCRWRHCWFGGSFHMSLHEL